MQEFYLPSHGRGRLHCVQWAAPAPPRAIVQIVHGIAEHVLRYDDFARFLNEKEITVVAEDHMGHGGTLAPGDPKGYFYGGWLAAVDDCYSLLSHTKDQFPGIPYVILGHSMGSFLTRTLLYRYPESGISGAILCGTGWQPAPVLKAGLSLCRRACAKTGETYVSPHLRNVIFGSYNKKVPSPRTPFDWICGDPQVVDDYLADSLCGFEETAGLDRDMLTGIQMNQKKENLARMNPNLPVLFIAGEQDPVGSYGTGVRKSAEAFQRAGLSDVTVRLYPEGRHEILNESIKGTVYQDVFHWISKKIWK